MSYGARDICLAPLPGPPAVSTGYPEKQGLHIVMVSQHRLTCFSVLGLVFQTVKFTLLVPE